EVDRKLEFHRLHHRQVGGLLALENAAGEDARPTKCVLDAGCVTHQAARIGVVASTINRGDLVIGGQHGELLPAAVERSLTVRNADALRCTRVAKNASITSIVMPMAWPAASRSLASYSAFGLVGFTNAATRPALGSRWRRRLNVFGPSSFDRKLTPVTFPPGRLRLATRPFLTGSPPMLKTIGIVVVAAFGHKDPFRAIHAADDRDLTADQVGYERGQPVILKLGKAEFDRHTAAFDKAGFAQALAESPHAIQNRVRRRAVKEPN